MLVQPLFERLQPDFKASAEATCAAVSGSGSSGGGSVGMSGSGDFRP